MKTALITALAALGAMAMAAAPVYADRDDHRARHGRGDQSGWEHRDGDRGQHLGRGRPGRKQDRRGGDGRQQGWRGGQRAGPGESGPYRGRDRDFDWGRDDRVRDWAARNWGRNDRRQDSGRGARHDGPREWSHDHRGRGDWGGGRRGHDWGRDDHRGRDWRTHGHWRRHAHLHRDFDHPRYTDWRHVPHGSYFDHGYARILGGYYRWWSYPSWHRPYRPYAVGYILPAYIDWYPLPDDLYYRLPPAPYGCRYILVNGDIVLIAVPSGLVLDALLVLLPY